MTFTQLMLITMVFPLLGQQELTSQAWEHLNRSEVLVHSHDYANALLEVKKAEKLLGAESSKTLQRLVYFRLGYLLLNESEVNQSIAYLSQAFSLIETQEPGDLAVHQKSGNLLVRALIKKEDYELAKKTWDQMEELFGTEIPDNATGMNHLSQGSQLASLTGNLNQSLELVKKMHGRLLKDPGLFQSQKAALYGAMDLLARRFLEKQNNSTPIEIYMAMYEGEMAVPEHRAENLIPLCLKLGDVYSLDGQSLYAYHYFEEAAKLAGQQSGQEEAQGKALFGLAKITSSWNNHDEAAPLFEKAYSILSRHVEEGSEELKLVKEAMEENQNALKKDR